MQIHVISPGDSLWRISQLYNVPVDLLVRANQIPSPNRLVVGQSLVIPIWGRYHWVRPGESLYGISRQYNVPIAEIIRINQIADPSQIPAGLRLYLPPAPRPTVDIAAYIDPRITGEASPQIVDSVGENLTFLNIFSYAVNRDGTLTPVIDQPSIQAAYGNRVAPLMVLTNFEAGTFSTELATTLFTNEALQDKVLDAAIQIMEEKGYLGLDFDFEYLGPQNRERYNQFLRKARTKLKEKGYFISSALAPKLSESQVGVLYEGHDYRAHGQIVDFIFFMTYEWGWSGGPPMAVSPIDQVRKVMEYALSVVPRNKIMMGIPLYGYDWTLPYVPGGRWARSISPQQAIALAARYGAVIQYDPVAQAPHFNYFDEQGREHKVWFEDARSIQAKFQLVKELGIRGFFYWVLGHDFPQNWLLIQDNFIVRKRVR
ncbi:glycoside hydrolase family 18 protein [Thermotalea metallivorans]|uniref:Spore germination protein YaaH n=1 Tax=Thermotalea metallivorans TaxID=520762 RepID=A0A140L2F8_9FIRM|nr:glycoside hydrolase family 18 protein [Thermotalea metallivorans]KXG74733.1 Spore germination protein YaaH [Thermotalea metallivorans]